MHFAAGTGTRSLLGETDATPDILVDRQAGELHRSQARMLAGQGAIDRAIAVLMQVCEIEPDNAENFFDLGNLLFRAGHLSAAVPALRHAAMLAPDNDAVWHNLANVLVSTGASEEAEKALNEAVRLAPLEPRYQRALALYHLGAGNRDEARAALERLVELDPADGAAHYNLAELVTFADGDRRLAGMQDRLADPAMSPDNRAYFGFALFRAFDRRGEHADAFRHLEAANRSRRAVFEFDPAIEAEVFARLRAFFTPVFFARHGSAGFGGIAPIFIVGMPRSGTTLTEQILSAHSGVLAGGEATAATETVAAFLGNGSGLDLTEASFSTERAEAMGRHYAARMQRKVAAGHRFTDKMPLNFRWVGIIAAMLPNARFVHCTRDPLDTCFSIYSSNFASNGNRYAYDLGELGAYHRQYRLLMAHWQAVLPDRMFEMPLEGLLHDQETQTRALLDFCGLAFEAACLDPQRNSNRVTTQSALQVREPVRGGRGEKVRPYLPYLGRLVDGLEAG